MSNKKIFIDAGFHQGAALREFAQTLGVLDGTWRVICLEPNPACFFYFPIGLPITVLPVAAWTETGSVDFRQEDRVTSGSGSPVGDPDNRMDGWGSTTVAENQHAGLGPAMQVPCVDFSDLIRREKLNDDDQLVVKLDIEGAEYPVLRHLLAHDTARLIDRLHVEFHPPLIPSETRQSTAALVAELKEQGVQVHPHH